MVMVSALHFQIAENKGKVATKPHHVKSICAVPLFLLGDFLVGK